jgi:hypothetical protein
MRKTDGAKSIADNGGGLYLVDSSERGADLSSERTEIIPERAGILRRNAVYRAMLGMLKLADRDRDDLRRRGFTDSEIELLGYKTVPDVAELVPETLIKNGYVLNHVPGFYYKGGVWRMKTSAGYFIPILNELGQIEALQIRKRYDTAHKYTWFSSLKQFDRFSGDYEMLAEGAGSGSPLHNRDSQVSAAVWITESPMKADYLWLKWNKNVVGSAGTKSAHRDIVAATEGRGCIVIAFDGDWRSNDSVRADIDRLVGSIKQKAGGKPPAIAVWPSECGIDEAIQQNLTVELVTYGEWYRDAFGR